MPLEASVGVAASRYIIDYLFLRCDSLNVCSTVIKDLYLDIFNPDFSARHIYLQLATTPQESLRGTIGKGGGDPSLLILI